MVKVTVELSKLEIQMLINAIDQAIDIKHTDKVERLKEIKKNPLGKNAAIVGETTNKIKGVVLETTVGGRRNLHKPIGDPVPRIC